MRQKNTRYQFQLLVRDMRHNPETLFTCQTFTGRIVAYLAWCFPHSRRMTTIARATDGRRNATPFLKSLTKSGILQQCERGMYRLHPRLYTEAQGLIASAPGGVVLQGGVADVEVF